MTSAIIQTLFAYELELFTVRKMMRVSDSFSYDDTYSALRNRYIGTDTAFDLLCQRICWYHGYTSDIDY